VSVPIYVDPNRQATRLWATLGVRLAKLDADYARPPHLKPEKVEGEWRPAEGHQLAMSYYLIPVDEFAEVELPGVRSLTRDEFRAVCDREKTKDAIVAALQKHPPAPPFPYWVVGAGAGAAALLLVLLFFAGKRIVSRHS